ncbi:hypothetical protein BTA51_11245 [Hahella sp. CCB-MM4]|uniref:hypothetical protein n=1 Tax=Hahella sp. (strain CCB-MM4) TaxID=1926491 RepID=UPI000B9C5DB7|nr:hypothetical protein [Hahella sp. CCB-MM4]OZG73066.1 hypothetical protein BTA51_11245 [Hahella sp. CCB-MM4]
MTHKSSHLDDETFLAQFEGQTLDPACFDHLGHMRLAWLYLNRYDLETAVESTCRGIKLYAESLGATQKFHYTLTDAMVRIMAMRFGKSGFDSLEQFLDMNPDLVNDALGVIHQYFSEEWLAQDSARCSRVEPDLRSFAN